MWQIYFPLFFPTYKSQPPASSSYTSHKNQNPHNTNDEKVESNTRKNINNTKLICFSYCFLRIPNKKKKASQKKKMESNPRKQPIFHRKCWNLLTSKKKKRPTNCEASPPVKDLLRSWELWRGDGDFSQRKIRAGRKLCRCVGRQCGAINGITKLL